MTDTDTTDPGRAAPVELQDVCYTGVQPSGGGAGVITITTLTGQLIGLVTHVPKHSPTGMAWGFAGSGPADCARSLLAAAIGEKLAVCPLCEGTNKIIYLGEGGTGRKARPGDPKAGITECEMCDNGLFLPRPMMYQEFKRVFVAGWGDTFVITRGAIIGWLRTRYPGHTWPTIVD